MIAPYAYSELVPDSPQRRLVSRLDLEIFETGEACVQKWTYRNFQSDPFFRLYYAEEGKVELQFAHGDFPLEGGHLYLLPANVPFRYVPRTKFHHYWLHFCSPLLEKLPYFRQLLTISADAIPDLRNVMIQFIALAGKQSNRIETLMQMDIIARRLLTPFIAQLPEQDNADFLERLDMFSRVLDYIDEHLGQPLNIPELATLVGMRRGEFSAAFRRAFGVPPKQYIVQHRIDRAKILLVRTGISIKEVAEQTGYNNEFFFYRIFKRYTGITPDNYRQTNNICLHNAAAR